MGYMQLISYALLGVILTWAAIKDIRNKAIPDRVIIFGTVVGVAMAFINPEVSLISALLGAIAAGTILVIISFITKGGIGIGDAKLFACAGVFLGLQQTMSVLLISTVLSGMAGGVVMLLRISSRKGTIPFAPFMLVGAVLTVVLG